MRKLCLPKGKKRNVLTLTLCVGLAVLLLAENLLLPALLAKGAIYPDLTREGLYRLTDGFLAEAEKIEEVKRLRSAVTDQVAHIKRIDADLGALCESFERLKTSRAREIKDAARYSNAYNKNAYFAAHNNLACKQTLPEAEYQEALAAIITPMQPSPYLRSHLFSPQSRNTYPVYCFKLPLITP